MRQNRAETVKNVAPKPCSRVGAAYRRLVTERHLSEIERVLLYIGDARARADRAAATLARENAPAHVVGALADSALRMKDAYRALTHGTFYAVLPEADP
jgi:hypothetical protein